MLRIRLISLDLDCWRDILLSFRFGKYNLTPPFPFQIYAHISSCAASGVCRLQPAVSPLGGSETSVSEQSLGDERLTLADVSRQDSHSSLATTSSL